MKMVQFPRETRIKPNGCYKITDRQHAVLKDVWAHIGNTTLSQKIKKRLKHRRFRCD